MTQANLLNHLWQSTVFAAAVGLLTLALRNNRASVRYWLWLAASLKFLIPFSVLVTIGSQLELRSAPAAPLLPIYAAPITVAIKDVSRPFVPSAPAAADHTALWGALWLCGASIVLVAWMRQWLRVRAAVRTASPLDLNLPIRAVSSPAGLEPGVFGIFRPVLVLPNGITDRLTPQQYNAIVTHELFHVRRRDNLTAAIHMAIEAIFWFHPLVWWIGKRLFDERERACDEAVLLSSADPESYAEGILNVCKLYLGSPLPCVSGVTGSNLKNRIRAIMTQRVAGDLALVKKLCLAAAAVAALAAPVVVGVLHAPPLLAQSPAAQIAAQTVFAPPVVQRPAPRMVAQAPNPQPPAPTEPRPVAGRPAPRMAAQAPNPQPPAPRPEQPAPAEPRPVAERTAPRMAAQAPNPQPPAPRPEQPAPAEPGPVSERPAPRMVAQAPNPQPPAPRPEQPAPAEPRPVAELLDRQLGGAQVDLGTYIIGANDIVYVELFGHRDFSKPYPVRTDGILTIPHFGDVKAEGLTPLQFKKVLTEMFASEMRDPDVTVSVWEVRSRKYTVAGSVKRPGSYPLIRANTTAFEAINDAGGFLNDFSNQKDILILRGKERLHFDYRAYVLGTSLDQNISLQNGDVIFVN